MGFIVVNKEHLHLLNQGVEVWNEWREQNLEIQPYLCKANLIGADLSKANLHKANLSGANLSGANLIGADFSRADLGETNLHKADLSKANLSLADINWANLSKVNLMGANLDRAYLHLSDLSMADLSGANMRKANLVGANLSGANLNEVYLYAANLVGADLRATNIRKANLSRADLSRADLSGADLFETDLMYATLVQTNFGGANLRGNRIYGISVWNLDLKGTTQTDLIITHPDEPTITVDNLEVAQFIYLLLNNEKIREVIDTISRKVVLIIGRFGEHKAVLDAIRNELRNHDYLPVLFDFEKPTNRDLTETVSTLAHLARFIIADITEPRSIPQELQAIVPHLAVPVQPLILEGSTGEYGMFQDLSKYQWVLPIYQYNDLNYLLDSLGEKVIAPAEAKAQELEKS